MRFCQFYAALLTPILLHTLAVVATPAGTWDKTKVIAEATGGQFKATKGKYFDKDCNAALDYEAEVIDLNGDGQPEVFTSVQGTCSLHVDNASLTRSSSQKMLTADATDGLSITTVTAPLAAGAHTFALRCLEEDGDIDWGQSRITAVMLGNG